MSKQRQEKDDKEIRKLERFFPIVILSVCRSNEIVSYSIFQIFDVPSRADPLEEATNFEADNLFKGQTVRFLWSDRHVTAAIFGAEDKSLKNGPEELYCCDNKEDINGKCIAGDIYSSVKPPALPARLQTTPSSESTPDETSVFQGLPGGEIIVYSICTGLISVILLAGTCLLRRYKQRGAHARPCPRGTSSEQLGNDIDLQVQATGTSTEVVGGIYETIHESSIPDLPISMHASHQSNESSDSSSDDNSDPLPNDGYLNPYQPMVPEFEKHGYSTIIIDNSDSDFSSSDKGERVSGYLNPYQTIVPDKDKHEYCKVNDDSCLEKNNVSDFSNQGNKDTYTDAHSHTSSRNTGIGENENQVEKSKPSDYEDSVDMDTTVQTSMCVAENELSHNEYIQTCAIDLKLCIDEHADSSDKLKKVGHCYEVRGSGDITEATCNFNDV
ncbi:unnamed protein product [Mytilus coruscus]|uniref:Uncharacterized protein n=1 Tax=Mytilus coruscus TaxID=42192 RepID=A0A6J8A633_MYTCO|nr:unnamed protein product [Mytilus coruscus]